MKRIKNLKTTIEKAKLLFVAGIMIFGISKKSNAQFVTIPDANFAAYLQANFPSAMNGNQMDTTDASIINADTIICSGLNISTIMGVQYFDNLKYLDCSTNGIITFPDLPLTLLHLDYAADSVSYFYTLPPNLEYLDCSNQNNQTGFGLTALPLSLQYLYCGNNPNFFGLPMLPFGMQELHASGSAFITCIVNLPSNPNFTSDVGYSICPSVPLLVVVGDTSICNGDSVIIIMSGSPGYPKYWFKDADLNPVAHSDTLFATTPGNYYGIVDDVSGAGFRSDTVYVNSVINLSVSSLNNVSCFGGNDGDLCVNVSGGIIPYTFIWSNGTTAQCVSNLTAGTYSVTVIDANGCSASISATVTEPPVLAIITPSNIIICTGTDLCVAAAGGTPPYSYLWSTGSTAACLTTPLPGTYSVTITDVNNCWTTGAINLTIDPPIQITFGGNLYICAGDSSNVIPLASGGTPAYNYIWSNASLGNLITNIPGIYTITVTDIDGCTAQDSINLHCDDVWSGDANYDGTANNLDLLPIGIGYGVTGPVRPGASLTWIAQPAPYWADSLASGTNYKHIDCNGDGIINDADTIAIIQNYGQTHPLRLLPTVQNLLDPYLYFDIVIDTIGTDQTLIVPLNFGTAAIPADSIYGLAFTVNYDTSLVKADSVGIDFTTSWIGTIGTDMITIQHNDPSNGQLHVGMTRIDHNNISGFGEIAKVSVVTVDNVSGRMASTSLFDTLTFTLSDVTIIDKDENIRSVNLSSGSLILQDSTTSIQEILSLEKIKIYPNPAKDKLFIEIPYGYSINEILITNLIGEKMESKSFIKDNTAEIKNLKNFSNGIYFLKIKTENGSVSKKFCVMH